MLPIKQVEVSEQLFPANSTFSSESACSSPQAVKRSRGQQSLRVNGMCNLPSENPKAFALVVDKLANVFSAILPRKVTLAVLRIVFPLAFILSAIVPLVGALAIHLVLAKFASESAAVGPLKLSEAVLFTQFVVAFKDCAVSPNLFPKAVVLVVDPKAFIVRPVDVRGLAMSV